MTRWISWCVTGWLSCWIEESIKLPSLKWLRHTRPTSNSIMNTQWTTSYCMSIETRRIEVYDVIQPRLLYTILQICIDRRVDNSSSKKREGLLRCSVNGVKWARGDLISMDCVSNKCISMNWLPIDCIQIHSTSVTRVTWHADLLRIRRDITNIFWSWLQSNSNN